MEECSVLIIASEMIYKDQTPGVYQRYFSHLENTHATIYKDFCHEYFKELEKMILPDMIGTDCARLFSRLCFLSYVHYANIIELYIPEVEKLSPLQKAWLQENYHTLSQEYEMDICIQVKQDNYVVLKKYEASTVKLGVIQELKKIVTEKETTHSPNQIK